MSVRRKGNRASTENDKDKRTREENNVSAAANRRENVAPMKRVRKKKDVVSSESVPEKGPHSGHKRRLKKLVDDEKRQTRLAIANIKEGGTDGDSRHPMPTRMSAPAFSENNCKLTGSLLFYVFPAPTPEETLLKLFYSDISQFDVVKYLSQSSWLKSLCDYKSFCLSLSKTEFNNTASLYEKMYITGHLTSEKEISLFVEKEYGFCMGKHENSVAEESEDMSLGSLACRQVASSAGTCSTGFLQDSVIRQVPEDHSTLVNLPSDVISDEGKHLHLEYIDSSASCLSSTEIVHDLNAKPEFCKLCNDGESTVEVNSLAVIDEQYTYTEDIASFKKCLYSLLRHQHVIKSHVNTDKLWWEEISFLHVYNITITSLFLYILIT